MKSKNLAIFFALVFCLLVVMFCQPAAKENPIAQTKDDLDHLMRISADVAELFEKNDARENLKTEILINFKKLLEDDFKNDLFRKMGKILDWLCTHIVSSKIKIIYKKDKSLAIIY